MRKKVTVGVSLVVVVVLVLAVTAMVCDRMRPSEPPLRVGMWPQERDRVMSESRYQGPRVDEQEDALSFWQEPDWFGNRQEVLVSLDDACRVSKYQVKLLPRTRPPWLDRALKAAGF